MSYIEEVPSGVRTIANVPTSITAFVGKAVRGPTDGPETIASVAEYERVYGGLHRDFTLGYAVRDFFVNGGATAVIVRLYKPTINKGSRATFNITHLTLEAANEGSWGMNVRVRIDKKPAADPGLADTAARLGLAPADLFDVVVRDANTGRIETFLNLSTRECARRADRVLKNESTLIRATQALPANTSPAAHGGAVTDVDVWTDASKSAAAQNTATTEAVDSAAIASADFKAGVALLDRADLFNLLCILPDARGGDVPDDVYQDAMAFCVKKRAMLIVDSKAGWNTVASAQTGLSAMNLNGDAARNAAVYFPRIRQSDPMPDGQIETVPASGMIAGVIARTDNQRGVWKAPAGTDAGLVGVAGLQLDVTDAANGLLNAQGINCLRTLPVFGSVVWGARTLRGADAAADEYKYIPVRRTALLIEESLFRGLKWVVFEQNGEPLWAQIRLNVGAFMHDLFRQGAFQGRTPREAYLVKCDAETTTQNDINLGVVNIVVGFAPLKPAEFVIIRIHQLTGRIQP